MTTKKHAPPAKKRRTPGPARDGDTHKEPAIRPGREDREDRRLGADDPFPAVEKRREGEPREGEGDRDAEHIREVPLRTAPRPLGP